MRTLWPILLLALAWGVGPALPALLDGQLLGHGFTDLYPSVWGMWWFALQQPGFSAHTGALGFPGGMGFYYSSPIHGWLAWPLIPLIGVTGTWNLLVVASRVATPLVAWKAARAWRLEGPGALAAATVYGCAPFFHGYAVEGIVEGMDGWTLALWAWAIGERRHGWAIVAFALTVLSSWYLGMCACLLALLAILRDRAAAYSLLGLVLVSPALWQFAGAFPGAAPLPAAVRAAMGAQLSLPTPGLSEGLNPFAITTYVGWTVAACALWSRSRWALLALIPAILSLGRGPIYDLPVAELVRFPYRWHAATLLLLAPAVGLVAQRYRAWWLAPLVILEGLLLSPIEPIIPGARADVPAIYERVDAPILELPGPLARPPGQLNPSRPRARYLLYNQTTHHQPSPWVPDFNAVGVVDAAPHLEAFTTWDPREDVETPTPLGPAVARLRSDGVGYIALQKKDLGTRRQRELLAELLSVGARVVAEDDEIQLIGLR